MTRVRSCTLSLSYVQPFDWPFFLHYFRTRSTPGVEAVDGCCYSRAIVVEGDHGVLTVGHDESRHCLIATVRGEAWRHGESLVPRVRRMFDLDADMATINGMLTKDASLARHVMASPGIRVPGTWSAFEVISRAIVGQQVSVKAASTLMGRIAARFGLPVSTDGALRYQFPTPRTIAEGDLATIGMPGRRAEALRNIARVIADESIPFCDLGGVVNGVKEALLEQPGIGPWTAEYFALRALREADAWPGSDLVLRRELVPDPTARISPAELERRSARWQPWRAYVAMHLWRKAYNESQTKRAPHDHHN